MYRLSRVISAHVREVIGLREVSNLLFSVIIGLISVSLGIIAHAIELIGLRAVFLLVFIVILGFVP